jgi:hypothetical protein
MLASSSGVGISAARSERAIITRERVTRSRREICFTCSGVRGRRGDEEGWR